jgi:hypothetical protein
MTLTNIEKMVQDGTRPRHELCLNESRQLPSTINTGKYHPPYREETACIVLEEYRSILRSKEVYMTLTNIEKMVQDGTRPRHELCLDESRELPSTINTVKCCPPCSEEMICNVVKGYSFDRKKST